MQTESTSTMATGRITKKVLEEVDKEVKSMRNNAVNIEFLKDRTKKLTEDVEKLIRNGNGAH